MPGLVPGISLGALAAAEADGRNKSTAVRFSHRGEPNGVSGAHCVCDPPLAREAPTPSFDKLRTGFSVIPGLVPGIHTAARLSRLREIPGTSPGMTIWGGYDDVRVGTPGVDPGPDPAEPLETRLNSSHTSCP